MALRVSTDGAVRVLTLDDAATRNALDTGTCEALRNALDEAENEPGVRAILLTGAGGVFCSGANFDELAGANAASFGVAYHAALDRLESIPIPVVAAINGLALGGGLLLALAADLRVLHPAAIVGIPAARLGRVLDAANIARVVRVAGGAGAREVLLLGDRIDAGRALALGLAHRPGDLDDALAVARELATRAPLSLAAAKLGIRAAEAGDAARLEKVTASFAAAAATDQAEGIAAWREGRDPQFGEKS